MPSLKSTKNKTPPRESPVVRTAPWGEFENGAPVKVTAERFAGKHGMSWTFLSHAYNTVTQSEWLEVFGGPSLNQRIYAVHIEDVQLIKPKRKRKRNAKV